MKIYTRQGDTGSTGLLGGSRVPKDSVRIEACGQIDELNAFIGLARAAGASPDVGSLLDTIQHVLLDVGAILGTSPAAGPSIWERLQPVGQAETAAVESAIDRLDAELPPLANFILPGGAPISAILHVARVVCRRAERTVIALVREDGAESNCASVLAYVNRLSDLLFVLAPVENHRCGVPDVLWRPARDRAT
jgi:cob(I)alamin adenosyltransferase